MRGMVVRALLWIAATGACAVGAAENPPEPDGAQNLEAEILDTAIKHCRLGAADQARALFKALKEQLNLSPAQLEIIEILEGTGCRTPLSTSPVRWGVQIGAGYDNNVNQGVTAQSIVLGSGISAIELELGDAFKPKGSAFAVAGIDSSFRIGDFAVGQVVFQYRDNPSVPALNLGSLVASAIRPFSWMDRPGRVQIDVGETWLGGTNYQRAASLGAQWLLTEGEQPWLASLTTLRTNYVSQPHQDNQLTEVGIWRERQLASTLGLFGGVSALYDHAVRQRPGGDRVGWRFQLGVTTTWSEWLIQPRVNVLRWRSDEVFSPGLFDVVRRHQLGLFDLQLVRPVAQGQQLVIEWRASSAQDTVPLFSFRGQSVGIFWRLQR